MSDPIPSIGYQAGAYPGIPGTHAPGDYTLDYDARTATPVVDSSTAQAAISTPDPNATQPLPAPTTPTA